MKRIFSQNIKKDITPPSNNINIDGYNEDSHADYLGGYLEEAFSKKRTENASEQDLPTISPDNLYEYLEDNYEGDPEETLREDRIKEYINEDTIEETPENLPVDKDLEEFSNVDEAINWAQLNSKTMRINYITKKGNDLIRNIEPHGTFQAKTGNRILVCYDQTINEIRAFIIDNIVNYLILEDDFIPKFKVSNGREIKMTQNILVNLKDIGDELDALKMTKDASTVTKIMDNVLSIKTAQYVGVQGYWIRNTRCFDNCYRQKRTKNKESSAQEVWFECQKEYEGSINNPESGWEKYAGQDNIIYKTASDSHKNILNSEKEYFEKAIKKAMKEQNIPFEIAVYNTLDQGPKRYEESIIEDATKLVRIASVLKENGNEELSKKIANVSLEMIREAQFWNNVKDVAKGITRDIGQGIKGGYGKAKDWMGGKVQQYKQQGETNRVNQAIEGIANNIETAKQNTANTWRSELAKSNPIAAQLRQSQDPRAKQVLQILRTLKWSTADQTVASLRELGQQASQSTQQDPQPKPSPTGQFQGKLST